MYLTLEEYREHKTICEDRKRTIEADYNKILEYTSPVGTVSSEKTLGVEQRRPVNATIYEAVTSFKNFVMYALYGANTKWAKSDVRIPLLRKQYSNVEELDKIIQKYRERLDVQTDDIFDFILDSNHEKEIGKAISDWGELGTGCWEYIEQKSDATPFTCRYVPLNELLFNEDVQGEPSIIFRYHFNYKIKDLKFRYPKADLSSLGETDDFVTVIECVMPHIKDDGTKEYECVLFDSSINVALDRIVRKYNPYTVFRFSSMNSTCWGIGLGMVCLDVYERIIYFENLRARQAARIVEPPLGFIGDKKLAMDMDFNPNGLNWLGDGTNSRVGVQPINTTGSLLPVEKDIDRYTQTIQQVHFNNPFGSADNKTTRAVEEVQYRMQLLQQKFSDAVSNLYTEVLIPSFMKPKIILEVKDIVPAIEESKYFKPKFVNLLTKTIAKQEVDSIIGSYQVLASLFPSTAPFVFKETETINKINNSFGVEKKLVAESEDRESRKQQALEQSLAMQRLEQGQGGTQNE